MNKKEELYYDNNDFYSFPQLEILSESELIQNNIINPTLLTKITEHITKYNESTQKNLKNKLTQPEQLINNKCERKTFVHGTSLNRAKNIQQHGFFEITAQQTSDLSKKKIGRDMRENYGGVGEQGITFFFKDHKGTPNHHALRVAKMDNDQPAIIEFDACVSNYITKYDSMNPEFIDTLKNITEKKSTIGLSDEQLQKEGKQRYDVRFYALEPNLNPIEVFQRLTTKTTDIGQIMDEFHIDGIDENESVAVLRNPNQIMIKDSFKIYSLDEWNRIVKKT